MRRPATQAKLAPLKAVSPVVAPLRLPVWLIAILLVLVTVALYWPATSHDFVNYDDNLHVTANVQVQKGLTWESLKWACLNPVNCIWHPLTVWSHMLDCQLFGLNPWGHHLSSVMLHAVNAGLVFLLLRGLTGALWRSVLVAVLFGWHPLHVESVAWVSERKDVLSGFFGLLALIAYTHYAQGRRGRTKSRTQPGKSRSQQSEAGGLWSVVGGPWSTSHLPAPIFYLLSLSFFALGLMSKPTVVTWPFVMLLLDYWPLRRNAECGIRSAVPGAAGVGQGRTLPWTKLVWEKAPFFALAVLGSIVTFVVQRGVGALAGDESLPLGARFGNALISYCRYLGKMFWPADLAIVYPHPGFWPLGRVLLAGGLILALSVLVWVRRRDRYLLVGWLWYCGTLVPVSQVIQTGSHAMADRYTYLPSLGVLILTVWGAHELILRWRYRVLALSVASGAATVLCLALTWQQIDYWKDSETLFRHALAVTENNWLAHNGLGADLSRNGDVDEAIRQFQEAIRLKPGFAVAHFNLGSAFEGKGQMDEAIRQYQEALRLKPDYAEAHNNLGAALDEQGQMDEAIRQYQEALRLNPDYAVAHNNLGVALGKQGHIDEAIRQFQEVIRLKPDHAEAHNNLGTAFYQLGHTDEAINEFQEALRLKPDYADARRNLSSVLATGTHASPPPGAATNH